MIPSATRRSLPSLCRSFHASAPRLQNAASKLTELSASRLTIEKVAAPKPLVPLKDLVFGKTFTDHMLTVNWTDKEGWLDPKIHAYSKISLDPSAIVFHYGMECFEGMKAYKDKAGNIRLFRPDMNAKRLWKSAHRLALPTFDQAAFLELLKQLMKVEDRWIPNERGYSVYIRPTMIGTQVGLSCFRFLVWKRS
jgi:branched-chain amino acid aminotransferase